MKPGAYTELFFLDEATALAAGHRPCAECQRTRYNEYKTKWAAGQQISSPATLKVSQLDQQLHRDCIDTGLAKKTFVATLRDLPDAAMVAAQGMACLKLGPELLPWSLDGYGPALQLPPGLEVVVLTPRSTVEALRAGYKPVLHESARGGEGRV